MNFEENNQGLQEIINKLEKEDLSLEEATKLYEEGVKLAKECYKVLDDSKGKITILKQELDNLTPQNDDNEE